MRSIASLKRALLATAGVFALFGVVRPAAAAPFYFYVITAPPNWNAGNPQPLASWSALTALAPGPPLAAENYVSLSLLTIPGYWYAYDTFLGEANGFIGADVSVPTAQWLAPATYYWTGGPAGGGALAFFNSFNPFTGTFYANMMIVLDPPSCSDALTCLGDLETSLGDTSLSVTPTLIPLDDLNTITPPTDDDDPSVTPDPSGTDYFASGSVFVPTPEAPTGIYLVLGALAIAGGALLRRRRRPMLTAA